MTEPTDEPRDDDDATGSEKSDADGSGPSGPTDAASAAPASAPTEADEADDADDADDDGPEGDSGEASGAGEAARSTAADADAPATPKPVREASPAAAPARAHRIRGGILFAIGLLGSFALMALEHAPGRGALYGIPLSLLAAAGLLDMLGLLSAALLSPKELEATTSWRSTWIAPIGREPMALAPVVTLPIAIAIAVLGALFGSWDQLPYLILGALAVLAPAAARRPGLLVFVVSSGIILPFLGVYGLWDPWETHYGEVAREILARDDWISLWWAHEEWFFSKPILIFWTEALSMSAFGFDPLPHANNLHPEWAVRFPEYVLSTVALLCIYAMVSRTHGKRAGAIASLVVVTLPHFFLLSHQAITDMPFVSTMTMAICMLGIAISSDEGALAPRYRLGPVVVSGQTLALGTIATVALPQAMYLFTRNVTLVEGGFAWHGDRFMFGSAGNAGNPGHPAAREVTPVFDGIFSQPGMQALYWAIGLGLVVWMLRRERRVRHLAMFGFYFFCGLSFMAKGIAGIGLPGMVALFYLIASRRWQLLLAGELRVAAGILVVSIVGMPWYVAMYIRHGTAFTDRILIHDHFNRLTTGVHGDTGSIEYFFEQLGFGLFPWIALAPLALGAWIAWGRPKADGQKADGPYRDGEAREGGVNGSSEKRRHVAMIVGLWGTSAFVLFSAMTTKFHHYIFPAVPAAGILFALAAEPLFGSQEGVPPLKRGAATLLAVLAPVLIVLGVAGWWGDVRGVIPEGVETAAIDDWVFDHRWNTSDCIALVSSGVAALVAAWWLLRSRTEEGVLRPAATMALFSAPAIVGLVGRDLSWVTESRPYGYERLIHLFVYNYQRPWPEQFDYRPILTGFAIVATVLIGLAAISAVRAVALRAFLGTALAFAVWTLDVYIIDLAPHWGQREIVQAIYAVRTSDDEEIIAWQMNWKGENFYTGNGCYIFVDLDNAPLERWAEAHPHERFFVLTEHSRIGSLRSLLRGATVEPLTTPRIDNKFVSVEVRMPGYPGDGDGAAGAAATTPTSPRAAAATGAAARAVAVPVVPSAAAPSAATAGE